MEGASRKLENIKFRDDLVKEIAVTYEVPRTTASSWKRNIGDLGVIEQTLGENAPANYLDLIQRREWIPVEVEEKEREWILPVKKCCVEKADEVYLVHESEREEFYDKKDHVGSRSMGLGSGWRAVEFSSGSVERYDPAEDIGINWSDEMLRLQDELERKEDQIRYEMRRFDSEWIALVRELWEVEQSLVDIYNSYLQNTGEDFQYKKDKIIKLKEAFPYLRANNDLVAEAVDSSISYVSQFKGTPEGDITNRKVTGDLRDAVFDRDDDVCVCCGSEENLVIHHVIPHNQGGENELKNLAALCEECHYYAHGGGQSTEEGRYTAARWDSVEYSDRKEFWSDWVDRDFEDRPPKSHTRVDFSLEEY
ncbi:MAG: HNH endonuclease [Halobacteriaceae archaeon]